jgi:Cys-rich protein (TIGR01571 family)
LVHARTAATFAVGSSYVEISQFWVFVVFFVLSTLIFQLTGFLLFALVGVGLYAYHRGQLRTEMRQKLGIGGSVANDCISHWFFPCCSDCQEAREAKLVNAPPLDFCSGEPMAIQDANHARAVDSDETLSMGTLWSHIQALSATSRLILGMWLGVFLVLLITLVATRQGLNFALLLLIFVQPLAILYFVYWRHKRRYAALDYVVKLFAVGFFCAPFQAIVLEGVLQVVITIILAPFSGKTDDAMTDDEQHAVMRKHIGAVVVGLLLMAFLVAAGVEETVKHFVVRCCRFPSQVTNPHTLLVYLMTGALGFATAENIEYVFSEAVGASGVPKVQLFVNELFVLVLRICLPIHVICSVMQAANLSKVVTGIQQMNLFQILLPAIMLHGSFDFVLFLLSTLAVIYPSQEGLCNVLTVVFVVLLTGGGVVAAVVMFNKVINQFDALTAQRMMEDNALEEAPGPSAGQQQHRVSSSTSNPMASYNQL